MLRSRHEAACALSARRVPRTGHALHRWHAYRGRSSRYPDRRSARSLRLATHRPPPTRRLERITGIIGRHAAALDVMGPRRPARQHGRLGRLGNDPRPFRPYRELPRLHAGAPWDDAVLGWAAPNGRDGGRLARAGARGRCCPATRRGRYRTKAERADRQRRGPPRAHRARPPVMAVDSHLMTARGRAQNDLRREAPGALRAPLKTYRKFSPATGRTGVLSRLILDTLASLDA